MLIQAAGSQALAGQAYATGGANHIRSSLLVVFEDTTTVSCAKAAREWAQEDHRRIATLAAASTRALARQPAGGVLVAGSFQVWACSLFAQARGCLQSKNRQNYHRTSPVIAAQRREFVS